MWHRGLPNYQASNHLSPYSHLTNTKYPPSTQSLTSSLAWNHVVVHPRYPVGVLVETPPERCDVSIAFGKKLRLLSERWSYARRSQGGVKFEHLEAAGSRIIENDHKRKIRRETENLKILGVANWAWCYFCLRNHNLLPSSVHHKASHIRSVAALKRWSLAVPGTSWLRCRVAGNQVWRVWIYDVLYRKSRHYNLIIIWIMYIYYAINTMQNSPWPKHSKQCLSFSRDLFDINDRFSHTKCGPLLSVVLLCPLFRLRDSHLWSWTLHGTNVSHQTGKGKSSSNIPWLGIC